MADVTTRANQWIVGGDTGSSSKCLWAVMMGVALDRWKSYPLDGGDLGRCIRLLEAIPEWRPRIGEMAAVSPYWAALASHWDRLESEMKASPAMAYKFMRSILDPIEAADRNVVRFGAGATIRF